VAAGEAELRYAGAGITYNLPQPRGTVVVDTIANFAAGNGAHHALLYFTAGGGFPTGPGIHMTKFTDNNLYIGWFSGVDHRVVIAATGFWAAGDRVQFALAYDSTLATTERVYVNMIERGTRVAALTTGNTGNGGAPARVRIGDGGDNDGDTTRWTGSISTVRVWPRMLGTEALTALWVNPNLFYVTPRMRHLRKTVTASAVKPWYYYRLMR
jgi:hypothetical protein